MESYTTVPVKLPNGAELLVEVRAVANRERDASAQNDLWNTDALREAIKGLTQLVHDALGEVKPSKVAVEFGVELSYAPGKLVTMLVNGSAKGNLKIAMEWSQSKT